MHVQTVNVSDNALVSYTVKGLKLVLPQPHVLHGLYAGRCFDKVWRRLQKLSVRCNGLIPF